jgi:hypothetical protein
MSQFDAPAGAAIAGLARQQLGDLRQPADGDRWIGFCERFSLPSVNLSASLPGEAVGDVLARVPAGRGRHPADGPREAGARSRNRVAVPCRERADFRDVAGRSRGTVPQLEPSRAGRRRP